MKLTSRDAAPAHSAHYPDSPVVTVLSGTGSSPDVGMVRVTVPAGAGMPAHKHGGSDVILTPASGSVRVVKGDETIEVAVGDALLILKDEAVALSNPYQETAELIVAAGPSTFVAAVEAWPEVSTRV